MQLIQKAFGGIAIGAVFGSIVGIPAWGYFGDVRVWVGWIVVFAILFGILAVTRSRRVARIAEFIAKFFADSP